MKKKELIEFMKNTGEYGDFFPFEFAPCPYQDSISGYYWPLSEDDMKHLGMWSTPPETREKGSCKPISELPDNADDMPAELLQVGFWDDIASKPFQVFPEDVAFSKKTNTPLPYTNFIRRLQENFRWMPFDGTLKDAVCMDCKAHVKTSWGPEYHHNLLCDTCYDKRIG